MILVPPLQLAVERFCVIACCQSSATVSKVDEKVEDRKDGRKPEETSAFARFIITVSSRIPKTARLEFFSFLLYNRFILFEILTHMKNDK